MTSSREYEFAEVLVDKLFLESFANEQSPYHFDAEQKAGSPLFDKLRNRLKYHIRNSLSARQKQVIQFYLKGRTEREIAQILGIKQQVVNIYKHRAIRKLHRLIAS